MKVFSNVLVIVLNYVFSKLIIFKIASEIFSPPQAEKISNII